MGSQNPSISERIKGADGTGNMTTDSNDADEQKKTKGIQMLFMYPLSQQYNTIPNIHFSDRT